MKGRPWDLEEYRQTDEKATRSAIALRTRGWLELVLHYLQNMKLFVVPAAVLCLALAAGKRDFEILWINDFVRVKFVGLCVQVMTWF